MEKEMKSCSGVLFWAEQTGHDHPTLFGRKGLETYFALFIFLDFTQYDQYIFFCSKYNRNKQWNFVWHTYQVFFEYLINVD